MSTFQAAKSHLLQHERAPFARRKAVFCSTVYNTLAIKRLRLSHTSTCTGTSTTHNFISDMKQSSTEGCIFFTSTSV